MAAAKVTAAAKVSGSATKVATTAKVASAAMAAPVLRPTESGHRKSHRPGNEDCGSERE